ncbi:MAG TPA: hypothetical protein VFJ81_14575 [Gemmatimonadales bacterium]|nr:hypothetical protein [Gemmatimonadales bacterium]
MTMMCAHPMRFHILGSLLVAGTVSGACKRPAPLTVPASNASTGTSATTQPVPPPKSGAADATAPDFANRVWKVAKGSEGDPGTFYVFLSDGSLLVTSPHGTPALGTWHYSGEVLTMVEQGLPHQATVLRSTPDTFALSVAGSGQPVVLTFVPGTAK